MLGLHDKQLAASLAVVKVQTAAEAERLTAEGEVVRRDQKSRKSSGNYLLSSARREPESEEEEDPNLSEEEEEEELMAILADLKARRGSSTERQAGRGEATSLTKCYNCGQFGHYRSDGPQRRKSRYAGRQSMRPAKIECRLCAGNHYVRECPLMETAKRLLSQESVFKNDSKPTSPRTSALNDSTSTFIKDGTAVINETEESPVRIIDPAMPMSEESTPGTARMQLFFVLGAVQTLPTWILADSCSVRNLVDETVYKSCLTNPRSGTLETVESSEVTENPST